jgi:pterin-4a-carbinolamine dehydratase
MRQKSQNSSNSKILPKRSPLPIRSGAIAEEEGHHPDIALGWGRVGVELSTHAIKGLSENDFIVAAKIDTIET